MSRDYDDAVEMDDLDIREPVRRDVSQEDKQMAMFAHLGGIFGGFLLPLIIWLIKKDSSRFVDDQGKEALNFQLTLLIGVMLCMVITVATCGFGFPILFVPVIVGIIYSIQGAVAANKGERYRYPSWSFRMVK